MMTRWCLPALALLVALSIPIQLRAQDGDADENPAADVRVGGLVVTSDPPGAVFTLDGTGIHLTGRTPWTITRGLSGGYRLRSNMDGYEQWQGTVFLSSAIRDTVHVSLSAKTRLRALWRSIVVPGWGQAYSDRRTRATVEFGAVTLAAVGYLVTNNRYWDRKRTAERAWETYARSNDLDLKEDLYQAAVRAVDRADDAAGDREVMGLLLAGVYLFNLFDAYVLFPESSTPRFHLGAGVTTDADGVGGALGLTLRY